MTLNTLTHKGESSLQIGLFGFGVVGQGLYEVLESTPGLQAGISRICIKNPSKPRSLPAEFFTTDADLLLEDPSISVIVELIDDPEAAFLIVKRALSNGKSVVSANKKMIAHHFPELLELQRKNGKALLYEAACCASIPIIRNLEEYYDTDLLNSVRGIINGSTNFILTNMHKNAQPFGEALLEAQQLGFAESNPSLDIEGHDAANKLCILTTHGFGVNLHPSQLLYTGITGIQEQDIRHCNHGNFQIKLIAEAVKLKNGKLAAYVLPQFVRRSDELYNVEYEYNALVTETNFADKHFFKGKGAGAYPTAAAVLSDLSALRYNYTYEYKKLKPLFSAELTYDYYLQVYVSAAHDARIKYADFAWIEEKHETQDHHSITGVIHAEKLFGDDWWKEDGVSLIVQPNGLIEDISYRDIGRRSLELAGIALDT